VKKITFENLVGKKKLLSHVFLLIITILVMEFLSFKHRTALSSKEAFSLITSGFAQLEIFISFARLIFKEGHNLLCWITESNIATENSEMQ